MCCLGVASSVELQEILRRQLCKDKYALWCGGAHLHTRWLSRDCLKAPLLERKEAIAHALGVFDRRIPGFAGPEGLLVGLESRSSGPLRLPRDPDTLAARGFANLFPVGEGAGYAGGIMSAAIDGARAARRCLGAVR